MAVTGKRASLRQPLPQGTHSPRVSGLSPTISVQMGHGATMLGVGAATGCPMLAARRRLGQLGRQPPGERQPCSQEAEAPLRTVVLRCSLQRDHTERQKGWTDPAPDSKQLLVGSVFR